MNQREEGGGGKHKTMGLKIKENMKVVSEEEGKRQNSKKGSKERKK